MKTIDYPNTVVDPVISEIRRHKKEIVEASGFDVKALGRPLQEREHGNPRFKTPGGEQDAGGQSATSPESKCPSWPQPSTLLRSGAPGSRCHIETFAKE